MRYIVKLETICGEEIGRRAAAIMEMTLNQGWDFETSFVYKDGKTGVEMLHLIFSRRSH